MFMVVLGTEPLSPTNLTLHGTLVEDENEGEVLETELFQEKAKPEKQQKG